MAPKSQYALPASPGSGGPRMSPSGLPPKAVIMHHTSGRGDAASVVRDWQANRPGIGSQYIVNRDGTIVDVARDFGYSGTNHTREGKGLSNANTVGYEVVAKDDKDVTPEQIAAVRDHVEQNYPGAPVHGHSYTDPGRKEATEGKTAVNAINEGRSSLRGEVHAGGKSQMAEAKLPGQYALPKETTLAASGYKYPSSVTPETRAAIEAVAARHGVSPDAIAGVIHTESTWNPAARTGKYAGLTQMGADTFKEAGGKLGGMTYAEYVKATPEKQVSAYGDWLQHYGLGEKAKAAGVDFSKMSPAQQAAYLQGFQFAPNATQWQQAYGRGEDTGRTTDTRQASVLGSTSMRDMAKYYEGLVGVRPPGEIPKAPDTSKGFETAAKALSGDTSDSGLAKGGGATQVAAKTGNAFQNVAKAFDPNVAKAQPVADKTAAEYRDMYGLKTPEPKVANPLGILGSAAGALGDVAARKKAEYKPEPTGETMADKRGPFKGLPSPLVQSLAPEPQIKAPAPTIEAQPEPPPAPKMASGPLDLPGFQTPTVSKAADLPPPSPLVPTPKIEPVDNFAAANAKLAEAFSPMGADKTTGYGNIYGDTPNAPGGPMMEALQQRASANAQAQPQGSSLEIQPGTPAEGSNTAAAAPSEAGPADMGGGGERWGGIFVPRVHTPLNFSGGVVGDTQSEIGFSDVNPWQNVNPGGSPAFGGGGIGIGSGGGSFADAAAAMGGGGGAPPEPPKPPPEPEPQVTQIVKPPPGPEQYAPGAQEGSFFGGGGQNNQRSQLAMILQRLNSGRLV